MKLCSLLSLSCVMPSGLEDTFTKLAESACSSSEPSAGKKVKANIITTSAANTTMAKRATAGSSQTTVTEPATLSASLTQSESGASKIGSKRARLMVDSCVQGRPAKTSTSSSFLSGRMDSIGKISLHPKAVSSSSTASSSSLLTAAAPVHATNRTCGICKTLATEPLVARCGHVCCKSCWMSLLKIRPSCPFCIAAVSLDQLRQLKFKP